MGDSRNLLHATRLSILIALVASLLGFGTQSASAAYGALAWTSPPDIGGAGVSAYDLRISTNAISGTDTLSWWNSATKISMTGKVPAIPGSPESVLLAGLVNATKYYAILRSEDGMLNWSAFSNIASLIASTAITAVPEGERAPAMVLGIPRPTPTSGRTEVNLDLPKAMTVEANVFNAQGRLMRTLERGMLAAGTHLLRWDGRLESGGDAASGVYWIRVSADAIERRVKVVVVR